MPSQRMPSHEPRGSVRTYVDLRSSDVQSLVKIFAYDDKDIVKAVCQSLPPHLRWRFAFTSPFCTTHDKVNFSPLEHIFDAIKVTIQEELSSIWMLMARNGGLDPVHLELINTVHNHPALVRRKCIACGLAAMALDAHLLVAIGAIHLASLNPKLWKRSKRILWIEHCLLARVELQHQKEIVREMWEAGTSMRQARDAWKHGDGGLQRSSTKKRAYVEDFATQAKYKSLPVRPDQNVVFSNKVYPAVPKHEHGTPDAGVFMQETLNHSHDYGSTAEAPTRKVNSPTPKPVRASSIYSHRPESANPNFEAESDRLFTHSEEPHTERCNSGSSTGTYDPPRTNWHAFNFDDAEFSPKDEAQPAVKPATGRMTRTVNEILDSYSDDSDYASPPTSLRVGSVSDLSSPERSLGNSVDTARRFARPSPLGLRMNNYGGDTRPVLDTPHVWKRRSQRDGTYWRYGARGELIQVTFDEYRDATEMYGEQCEIWQCI